MSTTLVRPRDPELSPALRLAAIFALFTFVFHLAASILQAHLGYGYFRDEMYYLICGRHLAWGYVDHGPLVALQARLAETLFGPSLAGIRTLSALAGAARLFLTGILAWSLGGRRAAQALAMIGVLVAPQYLGIDGYLSMNSFESLFWMTCLMALILLARGATPLLWLLFGLSAGLGLLNKPSMTFFLIALLAALLLTPQRRLLFTPWAAIGVALLVLIALPNLFWQIHNHWPTLEFLSNGKLEHKNVILAPTAFLFAQIMSLHPLNLIIWGFGLVWLLRREDWRWLGITYILFLGIMLALHAKDYYVAPIYPILFAAGGLAWEKRRPRHRDRTFAFPLLESALIVSGLVLLPLSTPILRPATWVAYTSALHLRDKASVTENQDQGPLPQFYADRFGWQEEADQVRRAYNALSPADQAQTVILCDNYGEASALNFLAPDLPTTISGHNSYFLWGPGTRPGNILITVEHDTPEHFLQYYDHVEIIGNLDNPWAMPYERRKSIFLLRGPHQTIQSIFPLKKEYI